jgi:hypothetical protein
MRACCLAERLRLLGGINAVEADANGPAVELNVRRVAVQNADDSPG